VTYKDNLIEVFNKAYHDDYEYVYVRISMGGFPQDELIINGKDNIIGKLAYYNAMYDDNLKNIRADTIRIVGFGYANSLDEIEKELD
jgi:hypothetical protein